MTSQPNSPIPLSSFIFAYYSTQTVCSSVAFDYWNLVGLDRIRLNSMRMDWIGLDWIGLEWIHRLILTDRRSLIVVGFHQPRSGRHLPSWHFCWANESRRGSNYYSEFSVATIFAILPRMSALDGNPECVPNVPNAAPRNKAVVILSSWSSSPLGTARQVSRNASTDFANHSTTITVWGRLSSTLIVTMVPCHAFAYC